VEVGADDTPADVISNLVSRVSDIRSSQNSNDLLIANVLNRFKFNLLPSENKMTVKPKTTYGLECVGSNGETVNKSINIEWKDLAKIVYIHLK
jgi:hypothetical protein